MIMMFRIESARAAEVRYDTNLFGDYGGSIMQLLKALLQKDPNKRPSSKKCFISLWTVAKPDVRNSSAAKAAYQAVEEFDKATVAVGHRKSQSRLAPEAASAGAGAVPHKVVRTSSVHDEKAPGTATAPDRTPVPSERSGAAPEASTELKPTPPTAPKPSGSFSFLRGFGWGKSSGKDGTGSQASQ